MKKEMHYQPQKFQTLKTILALIAAVLMVVEIVAGIQMLVYMSPNYKSIGPADYETLQSGDLVKGILSPEDIIMYYEDDQSSQNTVLIGVLLSEHRKMMVITAVNDGRSNSYSEIKKLLSGEIRSYAYKGRVEVLYNVTLQILETNLLLKNMYKTQGLSNSDFIGLLINTGDIDTAYGTKVVIASFMGAAFMAVLIFFLMRKTIHNIHYGILVQKGILEPDLKVRKEDLVLENTDLYQGQSADADSFYVNTDYDLQQNAANDASAQSYSFSKPSAPAIESGDEDGSADSEPAPMRYHEETAFYQSGLNEEGNFYVDKGEPSSDDDSTEHYKKY